jgi:hypothetical protein
MMSTSACDDGDWHPVAPHVEFSRVSVTKFRGRIARYDKLLSIWRWETCAHTHRGRQDAVDCAGQVAQARNRADFA